MTGSFPWAIKVFSINLKPLFISTPTQCKIRFLIVFTATSTFTKLICRKMDFLLLLQPTLNPTSVLTTDEGHAPKMNKQTNPSEIITHHSRRLDPSFRSVGNSPDVIAAPYDLCPQFTHSLSAHTYASADVVHPVFIDQRNLVRQTDQLLCLQRLTQILWYWATNQQKKLRHNEKHDDRLSGTIANFNGTLTFGGR